MNKKLKILFVFFLFGFCLCGENVLSFAKPIRIVSLAPNLTEWVYALGLDDFLVGVSDQCDFPAAAKLKPKIGGFTGPNLELILKLKPSHALVTEGNPRPFLQKLRDAGIEVVPFHAESAGDLPAEVRALAKNFAKEKQGNVLAQSLENEIAQLNELPKSRGRVLISLQFEPIYSATKATWLGDLFHRAHFENIVPLGPQPYPVVSTELLIAGKADYVVIFSDATGEAASAAPQSSPAENSAKVFLEGKFKPGKPRPQLVVAPENVLTRPGPRLIEGIRFLASSAPWVRK